MKDSVELASAQSVDYLVRLGAAMLAGQYQVNTVRRVITHAADRFGVSNHFLVLPTFIQIGEADATRIERVSETLRYDQTYYLGHLARKTERGQIGPEDGSVELDRILALKTPLPVGVRILGYALQSTAYALILQPSAFGLLAAACFGLLVGVIDHLAQFNSGLRQLVPALCAFIVTFVTFAVGRQMHLGQECLMILIAPLTMFLPGVGLTLAICEASAGEMISAAARLTQGFTRLAQISLGIVLAIQVLGITRSELTDAPTNTLGSWAPWLGVAVFGLGVMLRYGPPKAFLPWLLIILFISYSAQLATAAVFGAYASGFGGGLALMLSALALSELPGTPTCQGLLAPGFSLMVPSSVGLVGITELVGGVSTSHTNAITVMLVTMLSIALGFQAGRAVWDLLPEPIRRVAAVY